jgi:hypothetical protein
MVTQFEMDRQYYAGSGPAGTGYRPGYVPVFPSMNMSREEPSGPLLEQLAGIRKSLVERRAKNLPRAVLLPVNFYMASEEGFTFGFASGGFSAPQDAGIPTERVVGSGTSLIILPRAAIDYEPKLSDSDLKRIWSETGGLPPGKAALLVEITGARKAEISGYTAPFVEARPLSLQIWDRNGERVVFTKKY